MATLVATKAGSGVQPKGLRVGLVTVTATYSLAANLSDGDVIQMIKVPANATPVYVGLSCSVVANTNLTVNVGDGVSASRYLSSAAASSGVGLLPINTAYVPYTYSTDDTIDITVESISVTASAGAFNLIAIFSMNP